MMHKLGKGPNVIIALDMSSDLIIPGLITNGTAKIYVLA